MTFYEALPQDINNALYDYCKDNECLNDACLRALREVLKIKSDEPNRYSHDCLRCDKCNDLKITDEYIIRTLESKVEKLKEDLRNKRISIKNKKSEIKLLGERCNQLLKDKGDLTDELQELKETLAQTIENDEVAYETLKLHDQEEIGMLNSKVEELEQQIEKMKCCYNCSKWNDGECEESPKSKTFFCADFRCDKWECME